MMMTTAATEEAAAKYPSKWSFPITGLWKIILKYNKLNLLDLLSKQSSLYTQKWSIKR